MILVCTWASLLHAQDLEDTLRTTDSISVTPIETLLSDDSAFAHQDSTAVRGGLLNTWLIPAGTILLSCTVMYLFYAVRSK